MAEEAIFVGTPPNEVPRRITPDDIKRWHLMSFPALADAENAIIMDEAIEAVYDMFTGCEKLFDTQPRQIWYNKTIFLFRLLCCWFIADQHPLLVTGQPIMGPLPLKAKKIGSVGLAFQDNFVRGQNPDYQDLLGGLKSNSWGNKAYMMIRGSAKRIRIGGRR